MNQPYIGHGHIKVFAVRQLGFGHEVQKVHFLRSSLAFVVADLISLTVGVNQLHWHFLREGIKIFSEPVEI